jgi:CHAT domain/NACHT domain
VRYEDFSLWIEPAREEEGAHPVLVQRSPARKGERGVFRPPFSSLGLAPKAQPEKPTREVRPKDRTAGPSPREAGDLLFRALFTDPLKALLEQSLAIVGSRSGRGLRIKVELDSEHPELARLRNLPWELLYWQEKRRYLSLSRQTPVVRSLSVPQKIAPLRLSPPLRVLAAIANPADSVPLDVEREERALSEICGKFPDVELVVLKEATLPSLLRTLSKSTFHALHFIGHGGFDPETGQGALLLEGGTGQGRSARGESLAGLLADFTSLRLVVLNACSTARSSITTALDPLGGVAPALLLTGLPAVVAMQSPVSDPAALAFSEAFYSSLLQGDPVDAAVSEGRLAVFASDPDSAEWATPVLFLQAEDGQLFSPRGRARREAARHAMQAYGSWLLGRLERVAPPELPGPGIPPPLLESVYVPLPCRPFDPFDSNDPDADFGPVVLDRGVASGTPAPFGDETRIVLLGEAGSGKTTFLQRIALQRARECLREPDPVRVPILARLADFARARRTSSSLSLASFLGDRAGAGPPELPRPVLQTFFARLLKQGRALLLLDGLDEIGDAAERAEVVREIERFLDGHHDIQVIVASRIAGYRSTPLRIEASHWLLPPADPAAAERLCIAWSRALEISLAGALRDLPGSSLAANPRLATLLVLLARRDPAGLPRRRVQVFAALLDHLLRDFRQRAGLAAADGRKILQALANVAAELQAEPAGGGHDRRLGRALQRRLPEEAADRAIAALQETALLHPAFQEYLAALWLTDDPPQAAERIAERIGEPRWREPLLMALGALSVELDRAELEEILRDLLSRSPPPLPRAAFLLAAALPDMVSAPERTVAEAALQLLTASAASLREDGVPTAERWSEQAFLRLATEGSPGAVDRVLRAALDGEDRDRCLAAARLSRATGRRTAKIAAALATAQDRDDGRRGWPVHRALREIALHRPDLLPAGPGSLRRVLRQRPDLLDAFRRDPAWRRVGLALYGDADGPERMHRDSSLTPSLVAALESGQPARSLVPELWHRTRSGDTPGERADALLALLALGEPVGDRLREDVSSLSRLALQLRDEIPHAVAPAFQALRASASHLPAERWSDLLDAMVEIALSCGRLPLPLLDLEPFAPSEARPRLLAQVWRQAFAGCGGSDPVYALAVLLDTAGGPLSSPPELLARSLALVPRGASLPQEPSEILRTAVATLDGIDHRFDFVRGWALSRLAPLLGPEGRVPTARRAPADGETTRARLTPPDLLAAFDGLDGADSAPALAAFGLGAIVFSRELEPEPPRSVRPGPDETDLLAALEQLEAPDDRMRFRAALALHGDLSPRRRPRSARSLGPAVLERLARAWLDGRDRAPRCAQVVARALEWTEHDDGGALAAWRARVAESGRGAPEAQVLLGSIEILHPAAWPDFLRGLREGPPPVQRALVRSLCRLLARDRLPEEQWSAVAPLLRDLSPEAGEDLFLPDPPAAVVDAARCALEEAERGPGGEDVPALAERALAARLLRLREAFSGDPAKARDLLTEAGRIRIASRRARRQIEAAAACVVAEPFLLAPLLAWLCERLGRGAADSPFAPVEGDLLATAAAAAERMPDLYRAASNALPDLSLRLAEAATLHGTFPGRRAALLLLARLGRLTRDSLSALCAGLRDVAEVQAAVLGSLDLYRDADEEVFPHLCESLEDPSALQAHAAGCLMASVGRSADLPRPERDGLEEALTRAAAGAGAQREIFLLLPGPPVRLESAGRLADSFGEALARLSGITDLLETRTIYREEPS